MRTRLICIFIIFFLASIGSAETQKEIFDRGVQALKEEKFLEAAETFSLLILQAPDHPDAYKNRGVAYMKLGEYDKAINDFEKTRQLKPDLKGLYSNLGVAWYYKGDCNKAIESYNQEIALSSDNYFAFFNRAICWAELEKIDQSLADVQKSVDLFEDFYLAHCLKGDLLARTGQLGLAKKAYQRAIEIDPAQTYAKTQLENLPDSLPGKRSPDSPGLPGEKQGGSLSQEEGFSIQAGAFLNKSYAQAQARQIAAKGYEVKILELTNAKGQAWYLVRTGRFETREAGQKHLEKARQDLNIDLVLRPTGRF